MEHSLSDEAADALDKLMDYPKDCPDDHKPIPKGDEVLAPRMSLVEASEGGLFKVVGIDGGSELRNRLMSMGVMEGKRLRIVAVEPFGGPLVVKVGNTSVTIGRTMASKIRVVP
jgi:Fe2+ transport system protein FeoA